MMGNNFGSMFFVLHLHGLFMLLIVLAVIFSVVYVSRFFKKDDLKKLIVWFFGIGLIGCIITFIVGMFSFSHFRFNDNWNFNRGFHSNYEEMEERMEEFMGEDFVNEMEDNTENSLEVDSI